MSPAHTIALAEVRVALGSRPVLHGISATLGPGECVALVGPNGAGKTTLLRAMAGLLKHTGHIRLGGEDLAAMPPARRARIIGYLPQGHQIHWPLPVREVVALGRYPHGATDPRRLPAADAAMVEQSMATADIALLADRPADALSGGERARVALARVLATGAPVLLADEPTASLDPRHQLSVMATLRAEAEAGATIIAVTHDLELAAHYATRVLVLDQGRLVADGAPDAALSPGTLQKVFAIARRAGQWQAAP
jgi:iron complex transport system ATP-binding protein